MYIVVHTLHKAIHAQIHTKTHKLTKIDRQTHTQMHIHNTHTHTYIHLMHTDTHKQQTHRNNTQTRTHCTAHMQHTHTHTCAHAHTHNTHTHTKHTCISGPEVAIALMVSGPKACTMLWNFCINICLSQAFVISSSFCFPTCLVSASLALVNLSNFNCYKVQALIRITK